MQWEAKSPQSGVLLWPEPLEKAVEVETTIPWTPEQPVPLLFCPQAEHWLELPDRYEPSSEPGLRRVVRGPTHSGSFWNYTATTPSPLVRSTLPDQGQVQQALLSTHVRDVYAEHLQIHGDRALRRQPLVFSFPAEVEWSAASFDTASLDASGKLVTAGSTESTHVRVQYRTGVGRMLGVHWAAASLPVVEGGEAFPVRQEWSFADRVSVGPNLRAASAGSDLPRDACHFGGG